MKKVVVVLLFVVMMLASGLTALAAVSPELSTDTSTCPGTCRRWARRGGYDYDYDYGYGYGYGVVYRGGGGSGSGSGITVVDMSPKTGYSDIYAVLTVAGVLMCGSMAVYSGKKMREKN